jgi:pseudaminic acid cytidylyltransferase
MTDTLCIIPAKGNSSRCPRKNKREFFGTPMLAYSIETAKRSKLFTDIIVSTDDAETAKIARHYGATAMSRLKGWDELGTQELASAILNGIAAPPDFSCVIYATAPMMEARDLQYAHSLLKGGDSDYIFSVGEFPLRDAAQFYFGRTGAFRLGLKLISHRTMMFPIPEERILDVNTPDDWAACEKKYAKLNGIDMRLTTP